jgi:hypothetical protein
MDVMDGIDVFRAGSHIHVLESLWSPSDSFSGTFDPFAIDIPGSSLSEKLRYLFLKVVIQKSPNEWRSPDEDHMKVLTLKCLYAAMIGFNRNNLSLLYPDPNPSPIHMVGSSVKSLLLSSYVDGSSGVRDRCCGRVFEKGETYYRCR